MERFTTGFGTSESIICLVGEIEVTGQRDIAVSILYLFLSICKWLDISLFYLSLLICHKVEFGVLMCNDIGA